MISVFSLISTTLSSPLDQFGGDSFFLSLWQSLYCWFIEAIDLADFVDLLDMDIVHGILVGFLSAYFFSDDDAEGTE